MVLDTRWKKFKYSNGSKALCVVLALIMAAVFILNGFSLLRCLYFFNEEDIVNSENRSFYGSYLFSYSINRDISTMSEHVNRNAELKNYYASEAQYIEKAMELYKAEEEKNRLTVQEVSAYIEKLDYSPISDSEFNYYYDYYEGELLAYYDIYKGDDGNYYQNDFDFSALATSNYDSDNLNFGHTDERARELLKNHFYNYNYYNYVSEAYYSRDRDFGELENVSFYAENNDGTVFTNVENSKAFVNSIRSGDGDYIVFENDDLRLSGSLEALREILWGQNTSESRIYITLNTDFTGDDKYGAMFSEYNDIADINVAQTVTVMAVSLIAMIAFMVVSVRLAGHTEDGISTALIDKFPLDLHFAIMGGLVFSAGCGIAALVIYYEDFIQYGYSWVFDKWFLGSNLLSTTLIALACIIYLLILEFATSVARSVKAERPIIKKTAIFLIISGIFKLIAGFFKLIGKGVRKSLHLFKGLVLKPKKLEKKLVRATALYTVFNIISMFIIAAMICSYYNPFVILFAVIILLAIDAYAVYRAMKYLKSLDDIIDSSAKREPLPYETDTLPPSLKTLAESLEATNAELQEAVLKAVKDERTKAELITNVSHDLKTPLTSVINYIDLLQKCDIEDETAKQYMAVIEEKSARLKRLIEDLIEASKVSTGNVTLNKTKLNLCELASQAIVEETSDIEKNNLQIIFDETAGKHIVFADGTKIYRVFENLLSNARKYSAPYSRIYAGVYSDENAGYFEIKNISKDPLNITAEELTERFVRGDKSRSEEGNGLGLSIARELCKLNGGDLIISIDGDLFKATVKLPKAEDAEPQSV